MCHPVQIHRAKRLQEKLMYLPDFHHSCGARAGRVPDQEGADRAGEQAQGRGGQIVQVLLLIHLNKYNYQIQIIKSPGISNEI